MQLLRALLADPDDFVRRGARRAITRLREKTPSREKSRDPETQDTAAVQSPAGFPGHKPISTRGARLTLARKRREWGYEAPVGVGSLDAGGKP